MEKAGRSPKKNSGSELEHAPVEIVDSPLESWVFSTASCYHVTQQREILENYVSGDFGKVYLINGDSMDVVGKGDVRIKLANNVTWILRDVKHIPGHIWNLVSVGQLGSSGKNLTIAFSNEGLEISTGDFVFTAPLLPNIGPTYLSTSR
ncbi:hypothetical protein OROGR_015993 [Orobanche gracilis]